MYGRGARLGGAAVIVASALLGGAAAATPFTVTTGTTDTTAKSVTGTDLGTIQALGTLSAGTAITWSGLSAGVVINNAGIVTGTTRGIDTGASTSGSFTLNNDVNSLLNGGNDAFRINFNGANSTITINNSGAIKSATGQALDFDAVSSATAVVTINNQAGGLIESAGADAIRPGQGAVVNNAGTINVNSNAANQTNDGVDLQARAATVNNLAGGSISGARHGITTDNNLTVNNAAGATITGRNGSGVGSDGSGTVVNVGTISGNIDAASTNGDGDGVDIDDLASITNHGIIQGTGAKGVGSDGLPNGSEGIAAGGGTIVNMSGAKISGANNAILIDNSSNGAAPFALNLTNAGTIEGKNGFGLKIVGAQDDTVTNSGAITATSGPAIDLGGGNDTLKLTTGTSITGAIDGGAGTDTAKLSGTGKVGPLSNFEKLEIEDGTWTLQIGQLDDGAKLQGFEHIYALDELRLDDGSVLELEGIDLDGLYALYVRALFGLAIEDGVVVNIHGHGHNIYYDARLAENAGLGAFNYALADGGLLIATPEPASLALLAPALVLLLRTRARRRKPALRAAV